MLKKSFWFLLFFFISLVYLIFWSHVLLLLNFPYHYHAWKTSKLCVLVFVVVYIVVVLLLYLQLVLFLYWRLTGWLAACLPVLFACEPCWPGTTQTLKQFVVSQLVGQKKLFCFIHVGNTTFVRSVVFLRLEWLSMVEMIRVF